MKRYIQDIFTEDKSDGKYSSKKTLGIISGSLVCLAFLGDGFHWFTVNEGLFNSMLIFSGTMLGVSTATKIFKKSEVVKTETTEIQEK